MHKWDKFTMKPTTDKERLFIWCKTKGYIKTSDIFRYGVENYSNRCARNARELCEKGKLVRLSDEEQLARYGKIREKVYKVA